MDETAGDIEFDSLGNCNYCNEYFKSRPWVSEQSQSLNKDESLQKFVKSVSLAGAGKPYDCIVGVSGGVDSSWVLVNAVRLGLRPLAVHMDNGWNSNLAVSNISNLIQELGVDLFTYVIDWQEYKGLMEAFFKADVIDIELLYDNALHEVCYSQAKKYGLKYILSGSNFSTEGTKMPEAWISPNKWDGRNIRNIGKLSGAKIKTFPLFTSWKWLKYTYLDGIKWIPFLDLLDFRKESALRELEGDYGYTRYPYKHYESVFTRFYQGYILPKKFGVDKRRVHLSALVLSDQLSRQDAIDDLSKSPYPSERELDIDMNFFLKKMGWTREGLEQYLRRPGVPHSKYGSDLIRSLALASFKIVPGLKAYVKRLP